MNSWKKNAVNGIFIGFAVSALAGLLVWLDPFSAIHFKLSNFLYEGGKPSKDITIIAVDEKSLDPETGLGAFRDWPRSYFAQALEVLEEYKPAVVAFDFDFSNMSKNLSFLRIGQMLDAADSGTPVNFYNILKALSADGNNPDDLYLAERARDVKKLILATTERIFKNGEGEYFYDKPVPPIFSGNNIKEGFVFILADKDELVRRFLRTAYGIAGSTVKNSFAYETALAFRNADDIAKQWDKIDDPSLIVFSAGPEEFRRISFADIIAEQFDPDDIRGKIILFGATASVLGDVRKTPVSEIPMSGVEIHANIIQQILEGKYIGEQGKLAQWLTITVLVVAGLAVTATIPVLAGTVLFILLFVLYIVSAAYAFGFSGEGNHAVLLHLVNPPLAFVAMYVGGLWYHNVTDLKEKRQIKRAFSHYVNKDVVTEILKSPEKLKLGGQKKMLSVLFSDIVSFTSLAEALSPETLVSMLNGYLDAMSVELLKEGATLDKFEGDAIMSFFGAPMEHEDHAKRACESALFMRVALSRLHEEWNRNGLPLFDFCVGISTGEAVVGNFGSSERFDYTVIGDTVNLGARLESVNRLYGTKILADEATFLMVSKERFVWRKIDRLRVKGKTQPVTIYELLGLEDMMKEPVKIAIGDFASGLAMYEKRDFSGAKKYFEAVLKEIKNDGPSLIYRNRCAILEKDPPPQDWDFVIDAESK